MFLDPIALQQFIESAVAQYESTTPQVEKYLDELYIRIQDDPISVSLFELVQLQFFEAEGIWLTPAQADNLLQHLQDRLKRPANHC